MGAGHALHAATSQARAPCSRGREASAAAGGGAADGLPVVPNLLISASGGDCIWVCKTLEGPLTFTQ